MREKFIFAVFLIVSSALLLELGLRGLGYHPLTIDSTVWELHPQLGWAQTPGAKEVFHRVGFAQDIEINSLGLREREIPYENPEGVPRILFLGDSRLVGFEVPPEDVYTRVAEDILHEHGYEVEIINAGCRGWGTDQSLIYLEDYGLRFGPDLVIYAWNPNDLDNNLTIHKAFRRFGKSYFVLEDDGTLRREGVPVSEFDYRRVLRIDRNGDIVDEYAPLSYNLRLTFRDWTAGTSALAATLIESAASMPALMEQLRSLGRTKASEDSLLETRSTDARPLEEQYPYRLMRALVAEMRRVSNEAGAKFLMLGAPPTLEIPTQIRRDLELEEFWPWVRYNELRPEGERLSPPFDSHWNSAGHRIFGQAVAEELLARDLVPKRRARQSAANDRER